MKNIIIVANIKIKEEFKDVIDVIINIKEHKGKRWIKDIYLKDYYFNKGVKDENKVV